VFYSNFERIRRRATLCMQIAPVSNQRAVSCCGQGFIIVAVSSSILTVSTNGQKEGLTRNVSILAVSTKGKKAGLTNNSPTFSASLSFLFQSPANNVGRSFSEDGLGVKGVGRWMYRRWCDGGCRRWCDGGCRRRSVAAHLGGR
jgi:hypothetical protein